MSQLMEYLPPVGTKQQAPAPVPPQGADKYHGAIAAGYDDKRVKDAKWICEQRIIEEMIAELAPDSIVLDCPVGTGRFLDCYLKRGLKFVGADKSPDMLVQSALKILPQAEVEAWVAESNKRNVILPLHIPGKGDLVVGDIRQVGLNDKSVDAAVMCRLTRWLSPEDCQTALRELQRVCRSRIMWTARIANHPHARTIELFETALDGWRITRNVPGYVMDYRILMAEPA